MAIQVLPLFLVPEVLLPQLEHRGLLPRALADALFPVVSYGHGREFWRAYGLILAWPLNVYNVFTHEPLGWWLGISIVQTLVLIPLGIYFFGKGVYCGWICSCGALAETLGDTHRHKMPHGPRWNRFNMAGQVVLGVAVALLVVRVLGWIMPDGNGIDRVFDPVLKDRYKWIVDVGLAGVLGYGVYFWYSGRFWCRFLCPLAALMHVYARFSRFAIVAEKKKCISCNVCTSVCHQGIDIMSFANKGVPMADPECVRCSACVQSCPTGVLTFGQVDRAGRTIAVDLLPASPVRQLTTQKQTPDIRIDQQLAGLARQRKLAGDQHVADIGELQAFLRVLLDHHDSLAFVVLKIVQNVEDGVDKARLKSDRRLVDGHDRATTGLDRSQDRIPSQGLQDSDSFGACLALAHPTDRLPAGLMGCPQRGAGRRLGRDQLRDALDGTGVLHGGETSSETQHEGAMPGRQKHRARGFAELFDELEGQGGEPRQPEGQPDMRGVDGAGVGLAPHRLGQLRSRSRQAHDLGPVRGNLRPLAR